MCCWTTQAAETSWDSLRFCSCNIWNADQQSSFAPCPPSVDCILLAKSVHLSLVQVGCVVVANWSRVMWIYFIRLGSHRQNIIIYSLFPMFVAIFGGLSLRLHSRDLKENYLVMCLIWLPVLKSQGIRSKEVPDPMMSFPRHRAASITRGRRGQRASLPWGRAWPLTDVLMSQTDCKNSLFCHCPFARWFRSRALLWLSSPCNCCSVSWSPACCVRACLPSLAVCSAVSAAGQGGAGFFSCSCSDRLIMSIC